MGEYECKITREIDVPALLAERDALKAEVAYLRAREDMLVEAVDDERLREHIEAATKVEAINCGEAADAGLAIRHLARDHVALKVRVGELEERNAELREAAEDYRRRMLEAAAAYGEASTALALLRAREAERGGKP